MYFFYYSYVYVYVCIFSVDSLKLVIKELSGQPNPPREGGRVLPDEIYNVPLYSVWRSSS